MADEVKLIDRDEVGAKIQAMYIRREIDYGGENEFCRGMRKALRIIEDAPTVEVQPDNGWISVKDRLPDEGEYVLIYCPEFLEDIRKAFYTEGDFYIEKEDLIVEPVPNGYCTHWQPLPKPPKEKNNVL